MKFHGLLELDDKIEEIDEGIRLKNEFATPNGIPNGEILKVLGNCKELEANLICNIIKSKYKDRKVIDDEVRKAIKRLSVIDYENLDKINNFRMMNEEVFNSILNDMMNFDNGFMLEDYKNILREDDIFVSEEMQEQIIIPVSISIHVSNYIKRKEERIARNHRGTLDESNNFFRF